MSNYRSIPGKDCSTREAKDGDQFRQPDTPTMNVNQSLNQILKDAGVSRLATSVANQHDPEQTRFFLTMSHHFWPDRDRCHLRRVFAVHLETKFHRGHANPRHGRASRRVVATPKREDRSLEQKTRETRLQTDPGRCLRFRHREGRGNCRCLATQSRDLLQIG